jgi:hypothetical protein
VDGHSGSSKALLVKFWSKQTFGHDGDGQGGPPGGGGDSGSSDGAEVVDARAGDRAEAFKLLQRYHPRAFFVSG